MKKEFQKLQMICPYCKGTDTKKEMFTEKDGKEQEVIKCSCGKKWVEKEYSESMYRRLKALHNS